MGKPKFSRKKYETPSHPWQEDRIKEENVLIKKYGLKNKREIWKAETALRKYRGQARELLAKAGSTDPQINKEGNQLLTHLTRYNILPQNSTLDDVLALETESILSRRLQTLTYLKGLANTPNQARQLISHGHIMIGDRKTTVPSYLVTKNEEGNIGYITDSPLNDVTHPARPRSDFKSIPIKKEPETPKEEKEPEKKIEEPTKPEEETKEEKTEESVAEKQEKPAEEKQDETKEPVKEEKPEAEPKPEEKPKESDKKPEEEVKTESPKPEIKEDKVTKEKTESKDKKGD